MDKKTIGSLNTYIKYIQNIAGISEDSTSVFFYRGHYDSSYCLLPSVFRNNSQKEEYLYREILTRNYKDFVGNTHLQRLVKMQHYGCPTRLLDITCNPLVALFFACFDSNDDNKSKKVGEVIVFKSSSENVLSFDSDKALILSCLPRFSLAEKENIRIECQKAVDAHMDVIEAEETAMKKLYHEIRTESPAFETSIDPQDILSSFFVQPIKDNNRIVKQDGAFLLCGQYENVTKIKSSLEKMVISRINITNKSKILKQLDQIGINEASLFPELEHVSNYLKSV